MNTSAPSSLQPAEVGPQIEDIDAFHRCQAKFKLLRPVLNRYTDQNLEASQRWKFQLLCLEYVFICEAREEDSFFDYVFSPEGEVVEDEANEIFDAIYSAIELLTHHFPFKPYTLLSMEGEPQRGPEKHTGPETLTEYELPWLARYEFLKERGYLLRPRYRPGWVASWKTDPSLRPIFCEDWTTINHIGILDAQRISDGLVVVLKEIDAKSTEGPITSFLSSESIKDDPRNHAVPVLDVLVDNLDDQKLLLVLPLLRRVNSPDFESVPEVLDLIQQTLEAGPGDCSFGNILMDARALFPVLWHPQSPVATPEGRLITKARSRTEVGGVRYYFIDFGLSTRGESRTTGLMGNERAPELSNTVPYDPYRLDVYILGKVYQELLLDEFINVEFLQPLIDRMTASNPSDRPSAEEAYAIFKDVRENLNLSWFNQRLRREESGIVRRTLEESSYWLQLQFARLSAKPMLPTLE
ncbi:hypothetical protein FS837_012635 [Tulasnella sp. UAMH 9824]|nr:hypothetical protein FS837_012635 [Tulasnella sp. UAMH 9824]